MIYFLFHGYLLQQQRVGFTDMIVHSIYTRRLCFRRTRWSIRTKNVIQMILGSLCYLVIRPLMLVFRRCLLHSRCGWYTADARDFIACKYSCHDTRLTFTNYVVTLTIVLAMSSVHISCLCWYYEPTASSPHRAIGSPYVKRIYFTVTSVYVCVVILSLLPVVLTVLVGFFAMSSVYDCVDAVILSLQPVPFTAPECFAVYLCVPCYRTSALVITYDYEWSLEEIPVHYFWHIHIEVTLLLM